MKHIDCEYVLHYVFINTQCKTYLKKYAKKQNTKALEL